jgi:hypothetical protein
MQHLNPIALETVIGGTTSSDQVTQQLTALQTSLASLGNNNNSSSSSTMMMMAMAMAMAMRNQSTVIAGPAAAPAAVAAPVAPPGPVVNIKTRIRH